MNDRILKECDVYGQHRKYVLRSKPYVLFAQKYVFLKRNNFSPYLQGVGYLIAKDGSLTRDVSQAFVFNLDKLVTIANERGEVWDWDERTRNDIHMCKNGLDIFNIPLDEAERMLNSHPLPRKSIGNTTRGQVYSRFNGRCAYCGCEIELEEMQVDHFIAHMGQGGEDNLDNYYPACEVCNRVKSNSTIEEFKRGIRHCGEIHRKRKAPCMFDSDKIAIKYDLTKEDHEITFFYEKYEDSIKIDIKKVEGLL